jgi:Spy/CpxP family protein refolding chaperone
MKKGALILLLGLLLGAAGFSGFYFLGTALGRGLMRGPQPELAWLKQEFGLSDAEFARICALHEAYLPQCAERCRVTEQQNRKLKELLAQDATITPEIENLLAERAKNRAQCEVEMLKHFQEVSRAMPPEQGRRYLAWVQEQTVLRGSAMENRHKVGGAGHRMDMMEAPHL